MLPRASELLLVPLGTCLLDPHALIVGGGLGCVGGPYWRCLEAAARAQIWADAARRIPLLRSGLGPDAAAIGAALRTDAKQS